MFEEQFMKLVEQYQGFEIVHAYRDDVDHFLGGRNDRYWYVIMKNNKTKEAYVAFYKDGVWKDQYVKGEGSKKKVKEAEPGTTIKMIAAEAYIAQDEKWVKDKNGTVIEEDNPRIHYVKGFGDKALDVSKLYGVSIAFNDLDDTAGAFHLRDITIGDKVEIFE